MDRPRAESVGARMEARRNANQMPCSWKKMKATRAPRIMVKGRENSKSRPGNPRSSLTRRKLSVEASANSNKARVISVKVSIPAALNEKSIRLSAFASVIAPAMTKTRGMDIDSWVNFLDTRAYKTTIIRNNAIPFSMSKFSILCSKVNSFTQSSFPGNPGHDLLETSHTNQ